MAHFNYVSAINDIVKMDGPINNGPMMRYQLKAQEAQSRGPSGEGGNKSTVLGNDAKTPKTPSSKPSGLQGAENISKSGKKLAKTPGQKTPSRQPDRFIPSRSMSDLDFCHYAVMKKEDDGQDEADAGANENVEYKEQLKAAMEVKERKILNFKAKAPQANRSDTSNMQVLYSCGKTTGKRASSTRRIPQGPERVLDAPQLLDDYYLNLMDWSAANIMAVGLTNAVFLWNAETGTIAQLMELATADDFISSVAWVQEGSVLAVGLSTGMVQLWDTDQQKVIRSMSGHVARVGSLSWNQHILSSGSRTGAIHHHDVRIANHQVATLEHHTQEVCGLRWSPGGRYLASGGNDNLVNVWPSQGGSGTAGSPLYTFSEHNSAVKALSWCPWQSNLLATGGGTADRHIRLWNVQTGANLSATDTQSQVCSILWSKEHKELISGHGYALNHLRIWKYPSMTKVVDLVGHSGRILCMAMSPDGTTVASGAADETIRLWKCFEHEKSVKKSQGKMEQKPTSGLNMCIR